MSLRRLKATVGFAFNVFMAAHTAWADDASLYDEAPPKDAVFVRILSTSMTDPIRVAFEGTELSINEDLADTYIPISAAQLNSVAPGGYYSLIDSGTEVLTIEEPAREAAAKVHLLLLNAGPDPVRLVAQSKDLEVVAPLAPGQAASREVNPIKIDLAVERVSDGAVLGTFEVNLSRGQNLTFVAGKSSARLIENRYGPTLNIN